MWNIDGGREKRKTLKVKTTGAPSTGPGCTVSPCSLQEVKGREMFRVQRYLSHTSHLLFEILLFNVQICVCFLAGVFGPGSNEFFQGLTSVEKHALHTLGRMTRLRAFRHTHHIRTGVSLSSSSSWASQERHRHLAQSCLPCTNQPKCSPNQMHHMRELGRVYKFREGERKNGKEKEGESEREGECKRKRRGYCGRREKLRDGERKKGRHIEKERWID